MKKPLLLFTIILSVLFSESVSAEIASINEEFEGFQEVLSESFEIIDLRDDISTEQKKVQRSTY